MSSLGNQFSEYVLHPKTSPACCPVGGPQMLFLGSFCPADLLRFCLPGDLCRSTLHVLKWDVLLGSSFQTQLCERCGVHGSACQVRHYLHTRNSNVWLRLSTSVSSFEKQSSPVSCSFHEFQFMQAIIKKKKKKVNVNLVKQFCTECYSWNLSSASFTVILGHFLDTFLTLERLHLNWVKISSSCAPSRKKNKPMCPTPWQS